MANVTIPKIVITPATDAKVSLIMQGFTVPVDHEESATILSTMIQELKAGRSITDSTTTVESLFHLAYRYVEKVSTTKIGAIGLSTVQGMKMISIVFQTGKTPVKLSKMDGSFIANGNFSYCYNLDFIDGSELGYSYFKRVKEGLYRRIG